jgi:hypothetical protein
MRSKPSALKREYPALKKMKFLNFSILWAIFALLDPDPDLNCESVSDPGT